MTEKKQMKIGETVFTYTLNKKRFSTEILYEGNGRCGKSLLRPNADDFDVGKYFRDMLGIKTTSDFRNLGKV